MSAFPPQRTITSIPVSRTTALTYLSAYLTCSETQPYLLPNTRLDPSGGPTVGSSKHSVTIHNLKRMEAGLRGEWLAPSLQLGNDGMITSPSGLNQGLKKTGENNHDIIEMDDSNVFEGSDTLELMEQHFQDSQDFTLRPRNHSKLVSESNANSKELSPKNNSNKLNKEVRKAEKKARRKFHKKTVQKSA